MGYVVAEERIAWISEEEAYISFGTSHPMITVWSLDRGSRIVHSIPLRLAEDLVHVKQWVSALTALE
ncbi:hypothetical protein V6N12_022348 [Hibiscus sabdariffa]|uniref:Uncharacterized protein n=1 Tax=Hibiscus sabdariffa TaxID=183260 RepID=A0ABR2FV87_9ROSI